jgi:hypothetical protein
VAKAKQTHEYYMREKSLLRLSLAPPSPKKRRQRNIKKKESFYAALSRIAQKVNNNIILK